jgi:hypothetical protein
MYQIVWLGKRDLARVGVLHNALEAAMRDLGVEPATFLATSNDVELADWRYPVVAVWFAHAAQADPADRVALDQLLSEGCTVFPVVDDLDDFGRVVPESMGGINGFQWRSDPAQLVGEILRAFGLIREQRSAFISYRRTHSRTVAVQLFHRLSDHGYRPFLDTASVDFGAMVQETLWERMSDADLLLFLDTPGALSSRWVDAELTRAHNLGLGILQVVWPGWRPFKGTDLSTRFLLTDADFLDSDPPRLPNSPESANPRGSLLDKALDLLADTAERVRIRSLGSRRARIVGEIVDSAVRRGLRAIVEPGGPVNLADQGDGIGRARTGKAMPIAGLPSAECIFSSSPSLAPGGDGVRLVYDGLGMSPQGRRFLAWLDQQIPSYRFVPVDAIDGWLDQL